MVPGTAVNVDPTCAVPVIVAEAMVGGAYVTEKEIAGEVAGA